MSYPNLYLLLRAANRRVLLVGLCRASLVAISLLLFGLLIALVIDAVFALPSWGLIALDVVLLGICLHMLGRMVKLARRNRFDARRVARMLEHRLGITDSSLINSIELRAAKRAGVSHQLVQESVAKGELRARDVLVEEAVQLRPARKSALWAAGVGGLLVVAYLCAPSVFGRGITRLIDPTGDHPPFTLVEFEVKISPQTIYHGDSATIQATLGGPDLPDRADLVLVDASESQRVPMYSSGANEYLLTLERVEQSRDFYIDTPKGRSKRFRLPVTMVPIIESAKVTYHYPAYTAWSQQEHEIMRRDIRAIEGTEVEIEVSSNLPLARGTMQLFDGQLDSDTATAFDAITFVPDQVDPTLARARLTLTRAAHGRLRLVGTNQAVSPDPLESRILVLPDAEPRVEITQPEPVVVAVEDWQIPVTVQAVDDVEISTLEISMAINGFSAPSLKLTDQLTERRRALGNHLFDLAELGARPGDLITYYATAVDNHPSGEHFVSTETYVIQVISAEEYNEYLRRSYRMEELQDELSDLSRRLDELRQQREQMLDELQQLQERMQQDTALTSEDQRRMQELQQQLEKYAKRADQLAEQLQERLEQPQLYDMEQSYREMLKNMSQQLHQQSAAADQLQQAMSTASSSASPTPLEQQQLQDAAEKFRQQSAPFDSPSNQQLQQQQDQAGAFQKADQMMAQAERIQNVIQQQRDLADRLQQFQNSPQLSPEQQRLADRLAREQELLRQELQESVSELEEAARQAADQLPKTSADATKMCQGIRQSEAMGDQDAAAQSARQGTGRQAHQAAEQAASKLESFLSQCQGTGAGAASELDSGLALSPNGTRESLRQLSQARSLPGMNPGQQRGQQGGRGGSLSRFSLHGPHPPMTGRSEARTGRQSAQQSKGKAGSTEITGSAEAAESLSVESRFGISNGAGNLNGVPVGYRDQAEAYFRRLTDESP